MHVRDGENGPELWYRGYRKWYTEDPETCLEADSIGKLMMELAGEDFCILRVRENCNATEVCGCFGGNSFDMELLRGFSVAAAV